MIQFIAGLLTGGVLGIFTMCLFVAAGDADKRDGMK